MINWTQDADGIVTLTMDDPDQRANTMNRAFGGAFAATVDRLVAEKDSLSGVIVTSAKDTFFAGGDLRNLIQVGDDNLKEFFDYVSSIKASQRAITASRWTIPRPSSASPRSPSACCPAPAASPGRSGCWASPTR